MNSYIIQHYFFEQQTADEILHKKAARVFTASLKKFNQPETIIKGFEMDGNMEIKVNLLKMLFRIVNE